jgi:hypothetical protein
MSLVYIINMGKSIKRKNSRKYRKRTTLRNRKSKGGGRGLAKLTKTAAELARAARAAALEITARRAALEIAARRAALARAAKTEPVIAAQVIAAPVRAALMSPLDRETPPSVTNGHQGGPGSAVARAVFNGMTGTTSTALIFSIKDPKFIEQYQNVEDLKNIDTKTLNDGLTICKNNIENYSKTEIQDLIEGVVRKTISEMEAREKARKKDEVEKQNQTTSEEMFKTIASNLKQLLSEVKKGQGKSYADFAENINYMTKNPLIIFRAMLFLATICLIVYNEIKNRTSEPSPQEERDLLNKEAFTTTLNIFKTDSQQYV